MRWRRSIPAVQRITGVEFFRAMARFHVRATPPTSPLLFEYGRDFPAFIERYEYARAMPWLADTARIERAWLDAYHAADAEPLLGGTCSQRPARTAGRSRLHRASGDADRALPFPAVTIFAANRGEAPVERIDASVPEDALITRPDLDVVVRRLPPGGAVFLTRLMAGQSLGEAATLCAGDRVRFRSRDQHRRHDRGGRLRRTPYRRSIMNTATDPADAPAAL